MKLDDNLIYMRNERKKVMEQKNVTMKDVARLAGVGIGTVSRVVNGVKVKDSTYDRVKRAIKELNYTPDEYARGLKTNRSNNIALIIPTIWHPFYSEFAFYVEKELRKHQHKLLISNVDDDVSKEAEYIEMLKNNKVDGIIGITYSDIDHYVSSDLPFVSIDRHFSEDVYYVTSDNYEGGRLAAREMIKRGAKHLAYIGGKNRFENETTFRKIGFYEVADEMGVKLSKLDLPEPIIHFEEKVIQFLEEHPTIDGIFTVNDLMALDVITILKTLGKSVPNDCQIIGFDGLKLSSEREVLVSTINQDMPNLAKESVSLLLDLLNRKERERRVVVPVSFVEGWTTRN
jgi:LacI family transcriptional regulator